jgi:hypothetical protein
VGFGGGTACEDRDGDAKMYGMTEEELPPYLRPGIDDVQRMDESGEVDVEQIRHNLSLTVALRRRRARGRLVGGSLRVREGSGEGVCGVKPVKDRRHQVHAFRYVLEHAKQGAEVWSFRDSEEP